MRIATTLVAVALVAGCKLDSIVFSGNAVTSYTIPPTVVPDSLRREVQFASGSETLHAFWLRQPGAAPRVTVVFSHGKGGNLSEHAEWSHAEVLWQSGFDVLTYDYRGFGRSTGTSKDETTLFTDAHAALAFALTQPGVTVGRVVSYGHSLGSAPAIQLAETTPGIRALVVESGFANGQAMAESAYPLGFPVSWLLRQPMMNTEHIARVTAAVLIIHGQADIQIPVEQGRALFDAAHDPKRLVITPGGGHENVQTVMGIAAFATLVRGWVNASAP